MSWLAKLFGIEPGKSYYVVGSDIDASSGLPVSGRTNHIVTVTDEFKIDEHGVPRIKAVSDKLGPAWLAPNHQNTEWVRTRR